MLIYDYDDGSGRLADCLSLLPICVIIVELGLVIKLPITCFWWGVITAVSFGIMKKLVTIQS